MTLSVRKQINNVSVLEATRAVNRIYNSGLSLNDAKLLKHINPIWSQLDIKIYMPIGRVICNEIISTVTRV